MNDDFEHGDEDGGTRCPSCGGKDCEHWLVTIDLTYGTVDSGPLAEWCSQRLSTLEEHEEAGQIESALDALIDELEALPEVMVVKYKEDGVRGECCVGVNVWTGSTGNAVDRARQLVALDPDCTAVNEAS